MYRPLLFLSALAAPALALAFAVGPEEAAPAETTPPQAAKPNILVFWGDDAVGR